MKFLTPETMNRPADVKYAIKKTIVFALPVSKAKGVLPKEVFDEVTMTLHTLEGYRTLKKDDTVLFQMKGKGKYWAVDKKTVEEGFTINEQVENTKMHEQGWEEMTPKDPVRAWKINHQFKVKTLWGEMISEAEGGMLVQKYTNPKDIWIASFEDWKNYSV